MALSMHVFVSVAGRTKPTRSLKVKFGSRGDLRTSGLAQSAVSQFVYTPDL